MKLLNNIVISKRDTSLRGEDYNGAPDNYVEPVIDDNYIDQAGHEAEDICDEDEDEDYGIPSTPLSIWETISIE